MTREEEILSYLEDINPKEIASHIERGTLDQWTKAWKAAAAGTVISALRPVSREQVEKVWRGEWREEIVNKCDWKGKKREYYQPHSCSKCHRADPGEGKSKFCPHCGAPMTDEAVEMVMERMEALHDTGD